MTLANAGYPMLLPYGYVLAFAIVPIVLVEAEVFRRAMRVSWVSAVSRVGLANAASTLVGVPLTWVGLFVAQLLAMLAIAGTGLSDGLSSGWDEDSVSVFELVLTAPWMLPREIIEWQHLAVACVLLSFPFYVVSWRIEAATILSRMAGPSVVDRDRVRRVCRLMNRVTYAVLIGFFGAVAIVGWPLGSGV